MELLREPGSFEGPSLMKPMLLIVDDEKTQREGLRAVLEDHYEVYMPTALLRPSSYSNRILLMCCSPIFECRVKTV